MYQNQNQINWEKLHLFHLKLSNYYFLAFYCCRKSKAITSQDIINTPAEEEIYPMVKKSLTGLKLF